MSDEPIGRSVAARSAASPEEALTPPPPAGEIFGDGMPQARRFVEILADTGVSHGLIGPREVPRLWERHVLNCAVIADAFPMGSMLIDVGSGAGLPGLALAIARPDLDVHLVEPMLRRTTWLSATVADLGLGNVTVHRGRAEEFADRLASPWVTARAVARLGKLARWCVPLLASGGTLVAMKGANAAVELEEERATLDRLGLIRAVVTEHGVGLLTEPVRTVDLQFRAGSATSDVGGGRPNAQRPGARSTTGAASRRRSSTPRGTFSREGAAVHRGRRRGS